MNPSSSSSPANCSRSLTVSSLLISSPEILFWKKYFRKCVYYIIQTKKIPKSILRWSFTKISSFLKGSMYKSYPSKYLDLRISDVLYMQNMLKIKHFTQVAQKIFQLGKHHGTIFIFVIQFAKFDVLIIGSSMFRFFQSFLNQFDDLSKFKKKEFCKKKFLLF